MSTAAGGAEDWRDLIQSAIEAGTDIPALAVAAALGMRGVEAEHLVGQMSKAGLILVRKYQPFVDHNPLDFDARATVPHGRLTDLLDWLPRGDEIANAFHDRLSVRPNSLHQTAPLLAVASDEQIRIVVAERLLSEFSKQVAIKTDHEGVRTLVIDMKRREVYCFFKGAIEDFWAENTFNIYSSANRQDQEFARLWNCVSVRWTAMRD